MKKIKGFINRSRDFLGSKTKPLYLWIIWEIVAVFMTAFLSQLVLKQSIFYIGIINVLLEILTIGIVILLVAVISTRIWLSTVIGGSLLMSISVASYYIYHFRGTELMPLDFMSIGTGLNVVSGYKMEITVQIVAGILLFVVLMLTGLLLPKYQFKEQKRKRLMVRLKFLALEVIFLGTWIFCTKDKFIETWGNNGSKNNGFILNFAMQLRTELEIKKPSAYSLEMIAELEKEYGPQQPSDEESPEETTAETGGRAPITPDNYVREEMPNIIVIQEESFVDFSVLGNEIRTYAPVLEQWNQIEGNVIKGYALASVYGGGTANSEWEVLTGNTMAFLSYGATPYQLYINDPTYSMVQYLKDFGYKCMATHPYYSTGWSRTKVYPLLGFDYSTFLAAYPQQDFIRKYVSDQEMFEYVEAKFKWKNKDQPLFLWGITMQNHGGYTYSGKGYTPRVLLKGYEGDFPRVEQYLGLANESDKAIKNLLDYFSEFDEKVIILIYGDHYPSLDEEWFEQVHGGSFETLDEKQTQYTIPYVVWANYDIEDLEEILQKDGTETTCLPMFSSYIYDMAGIEQPPYNKFLRDFSEVFPSWNSQGFYSKAQGKYIKMEEATEEEKEWITKYKCLQYNALFDVENRSEVFFPTDNIPVKEEVDN